MRAARFTWNVAISAMLGAMIGLIGHQFAADAIARLWPRPTSWPMPREPSSGSSGSPRRAYCSSRTISTTRPLARRTASWPKQRNPRPDANLLSDLLKWAKAAGADSADALYVNGESISVAQRLGKREKLESSEGRDLGLRVFVGQRQAFVSSTDFAPKALRDAGRARRRHGARGPGGPGLRHRAGGAAGREWPDLDLDDKGRPSAKTLLALAAEAEDAARAVKGVTNSEGAEASWGRTSVMLAASNGFSGGYRPQRLLAVLRGAGRRRHRHGARLRMVERRPFRRPDVAGQGRPQCRQVRRPPAQPAQGRRARACRWSTTAASRAG